MTRSGNFWIHPRLTGETGSEICFLITHTQRPTDLVMVSYSGNVSLHSNNNMKFMSWARLLDSISRGSYDQS
jgi:hypothetical protein